MTGDLTGAWTGTGSASGNGAALITAAGAIADAMEMRTGGSDDPAAVVSALTAWWQAARSQFHSLSAGPQWRGR